MAIQITRSTVLLVEGNDDKAFFEGLAQHLALEDLLQVIKTVDVTGVGGSSEWGKALKGIIPNPNVEQLPIESLGLVQDADEAGPTKVFNEIIASLRYAGLPTPRRILEPVTDRISVNVLVLPDGNSTGRLEDLCLLPFGNDPIKKCADDYLNCVQGSPIPLRDKNISKAKFIAFLACKEDEDKHEVSRMWLGKAVKESWWPWDHPAFDQVKDFLRQIAAPR